MEAFKIDFNNNSQDIGTDMSESVQPQKKKKNSIWGRLIYVLITILVIVVICLLDNNFDQMFVAIRSLIPKWLVLAIIFALLFPLTDAFLMHDIRTYMAPEQKPKFLNSLKLSIIGLYYSAITPFATGGQPAQIVQMSREGIKVGTGTSIVCLKFIVYDISMVLTYLVAMISNGAYYYNNFHAIFWITMLGAAVNVGGIVFIAMAMINRRLVERIAFWVINLLHKIHIIKHPDKSKCKVVRVVNEVHTAIKHAQGHKWRFAGSVCLSFLNMLCQFSVTYFIYRAMGLQGSGYVAITTMQIFHYLAVSFVPTPGATGASEGGYYLFFGSFIPSDYMFVCMLLWRFLTYYFLLFLGSLTIAGDELISYARKRKTEKESRK